MPNQEGGQAGDMGCGHTGALIKHIGIVVGRRRGASIQSRQYTIREKCCLTAGSAHFDHAAEIAVEGPITAPVGSCHSDDIVTVTGTKIGGIAITVTGGNDHCRAGGFYLDESILLSS